MSIFVALVSLVAALALALWVWSLQREMARMGRRLDRYNKAIYDATDELRALREELAQTSAGLRVVSSRQQGRLRFGPEMSLREAQLVHPQVHEILASFHLGGCSNCAVEPDDTLGAIAAAKGLPLEKLLDTLNLLAPPVAERAGAANGDGWANTPALRVKLPNVSVDFE